MTRQEINAQIHTLHEQHAAALKLSFAARTAMVAAEGEANMLAEQVSELLDQLDAMSAPEACPHCGAALTHDNSAVNPATAFVFACESVMSIDGDMVATPCQPVEEAI